MTKNNDIYAVIYYDGCNGTCFGGFATLSELKKYYKCKKFQSRNDDGILELDEEGTIAVPTSGDKKWEPDGEGSDDYFGR